MSGKNFFAAIIVLLYSLFFMGCSMESDPVIYDNHGKQVQLSKLQGKWVLINFWADWCAACKMEVGELNSFSAHSSGKDYVLYGIDVDKSTPESQDDSIQTAGVLFPVLRQNPGSDWGLTPVQAIPTTVIIDPDGRVVKTLVGPRSERSLLEEIEALKTS